jgi:hypothetical protein
MKGGLSVMEVTMRKVSVCAILSLFTVEAFAAHNLLINGSSPATICADSSFQLAADLESYGANAKATIYLDANGNGQLDPGDSWLYKARLIDGGFEDLDEAENTHYHEICSPFLNSGKFLFCAEDNGVSDTVALTVDSVSSSYSVSGTLTTPANQADILVCLIEVVDLVNSKYEFKYGDFTDNTGAYFIGLPSNCANMWWKIVALDPAGIIPQYGSNNFDAESVFVAGHTAKDIAMRSCLPESTVVYGVLKDDAGAPITEPALGIYDNIGNRSPLLSGLHEYRSTTGSRFQRCPTLLQHGSHSLPHGYHRFRHCPEGWRSL